MTTERAPMQQIAPATARLFGVVLAGALTVAFIVPTAQVDSGPVLCPFRLLTGLPCPACGLTRAWVYLAHGQVGDAFAVHPLGPVTMLAAVVTLGWVVGTRGRARLPSWLRYGLLVVVGATFLVGAARLVLELA